MRILFEVGHPAHVHFIRNIANSLIQKGDKIEICAREREDMVETLLKQYGYNYSVIGRTKGNLISKMAGVFFIECRLIKVAKKFNPDICVGRSQYPAYVSKLRGFPYIDFADSEHNPFVLPLTIPFTDVLITPEMFSKSYGEKHIRVKSYKELAYLHPNWFKPNKDILELLAVSENEKYAILRFGSFDASHDIGISGFSMDDKMKLIRMLEKHSKFFISSESSLPKKLQKYQINIPPHRMHDALFYSSLLISDTQTSTTEAACLGTPAIRSNKWVGPNDMSNFIELEKKYGLIYNLRKTKGVIKKAEELLQKDDLKEKWAVKRKKLLEDKIDLTSFMVWFIKKYPESFEIMKENPEYQERFK